MSEKDHALMLYIMELFMNINGPITIESLSVALNAPSNSSSSNLYLTNNARSYQPEDLRVFFLKYPSFFNVSGDYVSLVQAPEASVYSHQASASSFYEISPANSDISLLSLYNSQIYYNPIIQNTYDYSSELAAVKFCETLLTQKNSEGWMKVHSMHNQLMRFYPHVTDITGPEFSAFLRRHSDIFFLSGEYVTLNDHQNQADYSISPTHSLHGLATPALSRRYSNKSNSQRRYSAYADDTQSLCSNSSYRRNSRRPKTHKPISNFDQTKNYQQPSFLTPQIEVIAFSQDEDPETSAPCPDRTVILSASEYSAIMLLRRLLARVGIANGTHPDLILRRIVRAPPEIREVIGWTRVELDEFLNKHKLFFQRIKWSRTGDATLEEINDEQSLVTISPASIKLKVRMLTGVSQSLGQHLKCLENADINEQNSEQVKKATELTGRSGHIYHVAKLWAIIDLGDHEHVFFDKSIFRNMEDLQRHFQLGETVYFNAVLAARDSRAKWRATRVWKEDDQLALMSLDLNSGEYSETARTQMIPLAPSLQMPTLMDGVFLMEGNNGDLKIGPSYEEEELMVDFQEEFDDVRFLGDQDLGLSLLSLADLDNLSCKINTTDDYNRFGATTPTEDKSQSTNSQVSSIHTSPSSKSKITNLNQLRNDREATPTINGAHIRQNISPLVGASRKCQATQTIFTGPFAGATVYKGSLTSLDDNLSKRE